MPKDRQHKIDVKVGKITSQFNDITRELSRALHREMEAVDLIQEMVELLKACHASIESEFPNSPTLDAITEMVERASGFVNEHKENKP